MLKLKQNNWNLDTVLPKNHRIPQYHFDNAPIGVIENFNCLLSRDVFSEGDSQLFYNYLMTRKKEFSPEFLDFLN